MNTTKAKFPVKGLRGLLAITALVCFMLAATGCGGGGTHCSAYGGKEPSSFQAETIK